MKNFAIISTEIPEIITFIFSISCAHHKNSKTFKEQRSFQLSKAIEILEQEEFDNAKPTVFYLHGYLETMEVESIKVIADAYLKRGDHSESTFYPVALDIKLEFIYF